MPSPVSVVNAANALAFASFGTQYFPSLPSTSIFQSSLGPSSHEISLAAASTLTVADFNTCFELITTTSAADYAASSIGWHARRKQREMQLPDMRYLLVRDTVTMKVQGFVSFMLTWEEGSEVIYCYELHVAEWLRGQGLGRKLMKIMEEAGREVGVEDAMLTVFVINEAARSFYKGLGYVVDKCSPKDRILRGGVVKKADYMILSKKLK